MNSNLKVNTSDNRTKLLNKRLCDLDLCIEGAWFEPLIKRVKRELRGRGLLFFPNLWLSDEWFCMEGHTGLALPFYLCNKDLLKMEKLFIGPVDGGSEMQFIKTLRHEVGHAIEHAFELQNHPLRIKYFGGTNSKVYPKHYSPVRYSKRFVINLEDNYAQSHPDEDFAETFAVWLQSKSKWKKKYKNWPALHKILAMDQMMKEISGQNPKRLNAKPVDELSTMNQTLKTYYQNKIKQQRKYKFKVYDDDLRGQFLKSQGAVKAEKYLKTHKKDLLHSVSVGVGLPKYRLETIYKQIYIKAKSLDLYVKSNQIETHKEMLDLFTKTSLQFIEENQHRIYM